MRQVHQMILSFARNTFACLFQVGETGMDRLQEKTVRRFLPKTGSAFFDDWLIVENHDVRRSSSTGDVWSWKVDWLEDLRKKPRPKSADAVADTKLRRMGSHDTYSLSLRDQHRQLQEQKDMLASQKAAQKIIIDGLAKVRSVLQDRKHRDP
eukprot:TRINITY_DN15744_c0_g1_i1.p1 TRINITY_DN15744_c0_g1~~TRINITY_DN15744_c0_g1_i1.p1  ORF type:complete len:152 (+),score=22.21 TRINITY_DN15744_c0_g1_i1:286-741(+)